MVWLSLPFKFSNYINISLVQQYSTHRATLSLLRFSSTAIELKLDGKCALIWISFSDRWKRFIFLEIPSSTQIARIFVSNVCKNYIVWSGITWWDWTHTYQDQDQDSLLVKRRNDNHSPGPLIRELVPSSHQRSELSNTILCIFSGWDQRIGEGIPIPDSLGEEATFINICIGIGSLKCHRVLIPTTPSFGDKVICWYTGFTFKTFI